MLISRQAREFPFNEFTFCDIYRNWSIHIASLLSSFEMQILSYDQTVELRAGNILILQGILLGILKNYLFDFFLTLLVFFL